MADYLANPYVASAFSRFTASIPDATDVNVAGLTVAASGPCHDYDWSGVGIMVITHANDTNGAYQASTRFSNSCFTPTIIATSQGTSSTWLLADHCGMYGVGEASGGDSVRFKRPDNGALYTAAIKTCVAVGSVWISETVDPLPSVFPRYKLATNSNTIGPKGFWTQEHDGTGQLYYLASPWTSAIQYSGVTPVSPITTELLASSGRPLFLPLSDGTMALLGTQGPSSTTIRHYGTGANSVSVAALEAVMGGVTITTVQPISRQESQSPVLCPVRQIISSPI